MNVDSHSPAPGTPKKLGRFEQRPFGRAVRTASSDDIVLPDPRKVNHDERVKRQKEKAREKRKQASAGLHKNLMDAVVQANPRDPHKQIAAFFAEASLPAASGRSREVSQKTRTDYGEILHQTVSDLAHLDKHLDSIASLKQRHVVALVRYWGEQEHAEGTIQWRVSTLRRFLTLIGRDRVIPKGQEWRETLKKEGVEAGTTGRSYLPEMKKGWIDCGIDAERKIAEIRQADPVAACLVELMWAFGLRFNEALQFMPRASEKEGFINVTRGTKGGKHREVPFSTINPQRREFQLRVLETAKQVADRHPKGVVAVRGLTLAQSTNRLRYILRKHGICKDGLGVVPHGMRHQFGTDLFRELTGLPAPVLEELPKEVYTENADLVYSALLEISRQMGHERPSISRAYLSSPQKMERVANKRLAGWLARLGTCRDDFARAGVLEAWVVGKGSFGLPLAAGAALQVAARQKVVDPDSLRALEVLGSRLGEAAGLRVVVSPWMDKSRPDEGAEILFNQSPAA